LKIALCLSFALALGCDVAVSEVPIIEHSGEVEIVWPAETVVSVSMWEPPSTEIHFDHDLADEIEGDSDGWVLRRCIEETAPSGALWLRPPANCGTYFFHRVSGSFCAGTDWSGCQ